MKLMKVEIPKSKLSLVPKEERIFLIQLTSLLSELDILQKLVYFSSNASDDEILSKAQNSQAMFLIKIQAGKLFEGWKMLERDFFGAKLSQDYEKKLTRLGSSSLTELKRYFGRTNLVTSIRNEFAFHYSPESSEKIEEQISDSPDSEVFEIFLSEDHGNCLYYISHVLVNTSILKSIDSSDAQNAMQSLFKDITKVTRWFLDFLGDCVYVILKEHTDLQHYDVEIPEPPNINEVILPYFVGT